MAKVLVFLEVLGIVGVGGVLLGGRPNGGEPRVSLDTEPVEQVVLRVFVSPEGATLTVDDTPLTHPVSRHGVYIPVEANRSVRLRASKYGFVSSERYVISPATGVATEVINLKESEVTPAPARGRTKKTPSPPVLAALAEKGRKNQDLVVEARSERALSSERNSRTQAEPIERSQKKSDRTEKKSDKSEKEPKTAKAKKTAIRTEKALASEPEPKPVKASLIVEFAPSEAKLILDDKPISGVSPVRISPISPGKHRLEIKAEGYRTIRQSLSVSKGEQMHFSMFLARKQPPPPPKKTPRVIVDKTLPRGKGAEGPVKRTEARPDAGVLSPQKQKVSSSRKSVGDEKEKVSAPSLPRLHQALLALAKGRKGLRILALYAKGQSASSHVNALRKDAELGRDQLRLQVSGQVFKSVQDLMKITARAKYDVIFIDSSLKQALTSILQVTRARKIVSLVNGRNATRAGASLGLVRDSGGAVSKVFLSRRALRVECCRAPTSLEKLSETID